MGRRHSRIIALFLLLVACQQGSFRLWMHYRLHESNRSAENTPTSQKIQIACDCLSEALMPLQGSNFFTLEAPVQKSIKLQDAPPSLFPDTKKIYYSLKGPPAILFYS